MGADSHLGFVSVLSSIGLSGSSALGHSGCPRSELAIPLESLPGTVHLLHETVLLHLYFCSSVEASYFFSGEPFIVYGKGNYAFDIKEPFYYSLRLVSSSSNALHILTRAAKLIRKFCKASKQTQRIFRLVCYGQN